MSDKQDEILAELAVGHQRVYDRQEVIEDVFSDSIIIPGSKVNAILLTLISFIVAVCFIFWLIRPI